MQARDGVLDARGLWAVFVEDLGMLVDWVHHYLVGALLLLVEWGLGRDDSAGSVLQQLLVSLLG